MNASEMETALKAAIDRHAETMELEREAIAARARRVFEGFTTPEEAKATRAALAGLREAYFHNLEANRNRRDTVRRLLVLPGLRAWWDRRRVTRERRLVAESGLFDAAWYAHRHGDLLPAGVDPITHYLEVGAALGYDPSAIFATTAYCATHPEASRIGIHPLIFHIRDRRSRR